MNEEIEIKKIKITDTWDHINEMGEIEKVPIIIPQCCKENWDNCPHIQHKPTTYKRKNIGL